MNKKTLIVGFVTILLCASAPKSVKADVIPANTVYAIPPATTQATADWAAVNMLNADRDYFATLITYNPYYYTHANSCFFPQYYR